MIVSPWEAVKYVSSGFSLCAFIVAAVVWYLKTRDQETRLTIEAAPPERRQDLVATLADAFHVDTSGLTRQQQYEIVMKQIGARIERFRITAAVVVGLAILGTGLSAFAILEKNPNESKHGTAATEKSSPQDGSSIPIWIDPSTGLKWTERDNGQNVNWNDATNFCANLNSRGYGGYSSGWSLPSVDELANLYDRTATRTYVYRGPPHGGFSDGSSYTTHIEHIDLGSCCAWSRTRDGVANAFYYRFHREEPESTSYPIDGSGVIRALCVHQP